MKLPDEPLSPAQREIMEIIWEHGEAAAIEIKERLADGRHLAKETIRTTLQRMEEKGWLQHRVVGRTFFYSAAVPKSGAVGQSVVELLDTVCGGSPERLVTALLDYRGLSAAESARIEELLQQAKKCRTNRQR